LVIAIIISLGIHASAFLGIGRPEKKPVIKPRDEIPVIALAMPNPKDLEEPDPTPSDNTEPLDTATYAPALADLPQAPRPDDFVQKIDLSSLVEHPDVSAAKVFVVPDNATRGATLRKSLGAIFNLADLDRAPEPLVRPPPKFPGQYKSDISTATVVVLFIVTSTGDVVSPSIVESSHPGFNESALEGVAKWRFRPGIKGGKKVNTRMQVPIIFTVHSNID
jgi:protein TonB